MKSLSNLLITLSLFIIVSLTPAISQAQEKMQDVIYLNNGSIVHGEITEIKANESITIMSNCGDKWVFSQADIKRVAKEPVSNVIKPNIKEQMSYKYKGFYSHIRVGFLFSGDLDSPFPPLSLMFLNGYQFDWGLALGAGIGVDLDNENYMPIVGDIRYSFKDKKLSHFVYFQGGYALALGTPDPYNYDYDYYYYENDLESKGGYILNPGIGLKLNLNEKNAFTFSIGYKYMEVQHEYVEASGQTIERTTKYNRITMGLGFHF